jgi:hypothetical protein
MPLTPDYGETPLPHEELTALLPEIVDVLDKPITRSDVYDIEQGLPKADAVVRRPAYVAGTYSSDSLSGRSGPPAH